LPYSDRRESRRRGAAPTGAGRGVAPQIRTLLLLGWSFAKWSGSLSFAEMDPGAVPFRRHSSIPTLSCNVNGALYNVEKSNTFDSRLKLIVRHTRAARGMIL